MKSVAIALTYEKHATPSLLEAFFESPELDKEIILGGQVVDSVETVTSIVYGTQEAYEKLLAEHDDVLEYEITLLDDCFSVYLRRELGSQGRSLLNALSQKTIVVVPPITIRSDRTILLTVVGHPEDLNIVFEEIPEAASLDVRHIHEGVTINSARLSDRQKQAIRTAWKVGYYEVPRQNGIKVVAEELNCAVSTVSELLRRAETCLVGQVLESNF